MALHGEVWFPNVIWAGQIQNVDFNEIKSHAYQLKEHDDGVYKSNYNAWQSQDVLSILTDEHQTLVNVLDNEVLEICKNVGLPNLELQGFWININPPGGYNITHIHPKSVLSGVVYVSAEEDQGCLVFERTDSAELFLPEAVPQKNNFNSASCRYNPMTSRVYIFGSWMRHYVEPNNSQTDRISISFNYGVKNHGNA